LVIHQRKYAQDILKRFNMENYKPVSTPVDTRTKLPLSSDENQVYSTLYKQIVGSLRYYSIQDLPYHMEYV
jgi:hypothetical protein